MSRADFQLAYQGPALAEHVMDVQELGPALLAVGDLCREAHRVVNGERGEVKILVRANTEEHCFDIFFELHTLYEEMKTLVQSEDTTTAKEILEWLGLIGFSALSLIGYLKWKRGRKIKGVEEVQQSDGGINYKITVEGHDNTIEISSPVYHLSRDAAVRAAQKRITAPLKNEGIDKLEVREDKKVIGEITKSETQEGYFDVVASEVEEEEKLEPQQFKAVLLLRAPVFVEDAKWQFFLGKQRITALIKDEQFKLRVFEGKERFGVGDRFKVVMSLTQILTPEGKYRTEYEIIEIQAVWPEPKQRGLFNDIKQDE